jgi:hypothetical protein
MGIFRPYNDIRRARSTTLANQAQLYFHQHKEDARLAEASAKKLHEALQKIATSRSKTLNELLGLPDEPYDNIVFDGGFEHGGMSSVHATMTFAQWFGFASVGAGLGAGVGAQCMFRYASSLLATMAEGTGAGRNTFNLYWLGRAARNGNGGFGRLGQQAFRWSRWARFLEVGSMVLVPLSFGIELWADESAYHTLLDSIKDLAPMRLDACAHAGLMRIFSKTMGDLAVTADVFANNVSISSLFDVKKELDSFNQSFLAAFNTAGQEAYKTLREADSAQNAYIADDPDLTEHVFDLYEANKTSRVVQLGVSSTDVVYSLQAQTDHHDGLHFGRPGEFSDTYTFDADETISSAIWKTGHIDMVRKPTVLDGFPEVWDVRHQGVEYVLAAGDAV